MTNTCETCKWWDRHGRADVGLCRVKSPVNVSVAGRGVWPTTLDVDRCGEHLPHDDVRLSPEGTARLKEILANAPKPLTDPVVRNL